MQDLTAEAPAAASLPDPRDADREFDAIERRPLSDEPTIIRGCYGPLRETAVLGTITTLEGELLDQALTLGAANLGLPRFVLMLDRWIQVGPLEVDRVFVTGLPDVYAWPGRRRLLGRLEVAKARGLRYAHLSKAYPAS